MLRGRSRLRKLLGLEEVRIGPAAPGGSDVGSFDTSLDMCRGFTTLALDFEFRFEPLGKQGAMLRRTHVGVVTQRVYDP